MMSDAAGMYQHIIFDFDGVLCDNTNLAIAAYEALRDHSYGQLPALSGRRDLGEVCSGRSSRWLHDWLDPEVASGFWKSHERLLGSYSASMRLFDGLGYALTLLSPGQAAVVTGGSGQRVREILNRETGGIPGALSTVLGNDSSGSKEEKIRALCADWGADGEGTALVGDTESDMLAAQAVPVDAIAVGYGYQVGGQIMRSQPNHYLATPSDLTEFLRNRMRTDGGGIGS